MTDDQFVHHPELRDLIKDPAGSRFREMSVASLKETMRGIGISTDWLRSDHEREALRRAFLDGLTDQMRDSDGGSTGLWVFAYGSLMWDPGVHFTQVRRAHLPKYARRFILRDVNGGRGTPDAPGLMAALDHGAEGCDGLAFLIDAAQIEAETTVLWQREMIGAAYLPIFAPAQTQHGPIQCLTFIADHRADSIVADLSRAQQIQYIATGEGVLGTSLDYLRGIDIHFAALGIDDHCVKSLLVEAEQLASA